MKYTFISESDPKDFPVPIEKRAYATLHRKEDVRAIMNLIKALNCVDCVATCNNGTEDHPEIINIASVQTIAGKRYVTGPC